MLTAFARVAALDGTDRWLVIRAFLWLTTMDLALRAFGLRWVVAHARHIEGREADAYTMHRARRYARRIGAAARRHPLPVACLQRSLVLHYWLRADGVPSEFRIGVRKEDGVLKAHAWIEIDGRPINERAAQLAGFARLDGIAETEAVHGLRWPRPIEAGARR